MQKKLNVAIVGATGVVGQKIIHMLNERNFPVHEIKLLSSERSAGTIIHFNDREIVVEKATKDQFNNIDLVFFAAGGHVSKLLAYEAIQSGATVIDNTSAFRMDHDVPLVVPEVNESALFNHKGLIANPNCSTIQMVVALAPIKKKFGLNKIVASTYQSVSGAGMNAIDELNEQVKQHIDNQHMTANILPVRSADHHYPIAFNVLPQIDQFEDNGYTKEEMKMINETKKILKSDELAVSATCVRVPVITSHSESIYIEIDKIGITVDDLRHTLKQAKGVKVLDNPAEQKYPTPIEVANKDDVYVGRIRKDLSAKKGFHLWIVTDNLLKGAALNSVQIAESLMRNKLI